MNTTITVIQQDDAFPLGAAADLLAHSRLIRLHDGDPVPAVADVPGGLVILGGHAAVHELDVAPWLDGLRGLIGGALEANVPVLAIGLGAQLLAQASGGHVQVAAPPGVELGAIQLFWRRGAMDDAVLGAVVSEDSRTMLAVAAHSDAVAELPPATEWLATSELYPFQAFRVGSGLGLQFHPEVTAELLTQWTADLDESEQTAQREAYAAAQGEIERNGAAIIAAFVDVVVRAGLPA